MNAKGGIQVEAKDLGRRAATVRNDYEAHPVLVVPVSVSNLQPGTFLHTTITIPGAAAPITTMCKVETVGAVELELRVASQRSDLLTAVLRFLESEPEADNDEQDVDDDVDDDAVTGRPAPQESLPTVDSSLLASIPSAASVPSEFETSSDVDASSVPPATESASDPKTPSIAPSDAPIDSTSSPSIPTLDPSLLASIPVPHFPPALEGSDPELSLEEAEALAVRRISEANEKQKEGDFKAAYDLTIEAMDVFPIDAHAKHVELAQIAWTGLKDAPLALQHVRAAESLAPGFADALRLKREIAQETEPEKPVEKPKPKPEAKPKEQELSVDQVTKKNRQGLLIALFVVLPMIAYNIWAHVIDADPKPREISVERLSQWVDAEKATISGANLRVILSESAKWYQQSNEEKEEVLRRLHQKARSLGATSVEVQNEGRTALGIAMTRIADTSIQNREESDPAVKKRRDEAFAALPPIIVKVYQ